MKYLKSTVGIAAIPAMLIVLALAFLLWVIGAMSWLLCAMCLCGWQDAHTAVEEMAQKLLVACESNEK